MNIESRCKFLYGDEQGAELSAKIRNCIAESKRRQTVETFLLSEKDVILILYGDHVKKDGLLPLRSMGQFLDLKVGHLVNTLHILPHYPYTSDDGFSVSDYYAVDPDLGTWSDITELAKKRRLMFDAVINHSSQSCRWFKEYLRGNQEFANFYHEVDPESDLSQVIRPRALPLLTPFEDGQGKVRHIWTTFSEDQVDLNFSNPKVMLEIVKLLLFYLEHGASLLRLDAIAFLWKEIGTNCLNLPQTHQAVKLFRDIFNEVNPSTVIITETNIPHAENISYFGDGLDEAQLVYNFSLPPLLAHAILRENTFVLSSWIKELRLPSQQTAFFNFTASHDGVGLRPVTGILPEEEIEYLCRTAVDHGGLVSYKNNNDGSQSPYEINCCYIDLLTPLEAGDEERVSRFLLSQAVMLSMPGVPGIYFHSLVGSRNDTKGMKLSGRARSINREKLEMDKLLKELDTQGQFRHHVFTAYLHMLAVRQQKKAFNPFVAHQIHDFGHAILGLQRDDVLCVFNFSNKEQTLNLPSSFSTSIDLLQKCLVNEGRLVLKPWSYAWLC